MLLNAQDKPDNPSVEDLGTQYSFVEIWDVRGRSREDFLKEITRLPAGICQQSLLQMGHLDGLKFPLASGKLLVTTRTAPDFRDTEIYRRLKKSGETVDAAKWKPLTQKNLQTTEAQLLPVFLRSLKEGNRVEFDRIFEKQYSEFEQYGLKLDPVRVLDAFQTYQVSSQTISKQEALSVLYLSQDEKLLQAASFILGHYVNTSEDLVAVLPLLLNYKVQVQATICSFIESFRGDIAWDDQVSLLSKVLNNPNPFATLLVVRLLDKTEVSNIVVQRCLNSKAESFIEILKSNVLPNEKQELLLFLNKYYNSKLDAGQWIDRLGKSE